MADIIIIVILVSILSGAVWYLRNAKKRGKTCIGCPDSKQCSGGCHCGETDIRQNHR